MKFFLILLFIIYSTTVTATTYWIKSSGSNTWPFDTEAKATTNFNALYIALNAHSISELGSTDIVETRGYIVEIVSSAFVFSGQTGSVIRGRNSNADSIYLDDQNWFEGVILRNLTVTTDKTGKICVGYSPEISGCRLKYTGTTSNFSLFNISVDDGLSCMVFNNVFLNTCPNNVDFSFYNTSDSSNVIVENNTFIDMPIIHIENDGVGFKIYFRNNIVCNDNIPAQNEKCVNIELGSIAPEGIDFQHSNNCLHGVNTGYAYTINETPVSQSLSENSIDPLFIGSGNEPYALQNGSLARHTGYHFDDSPTEDILGAVRPDPPSRGAFEDILSENSRGMIRISPFQNRNYR